MLAGGNNISSERRVMATHTARSAKPTMAAHDVPGEFGEPNNNKRDAGAAKKTITTQGVDEYISFDDVQHDLHIRQSPQDRQVSPIVLNSSLSDDSSSTLDGLNIDFSSAPCDFTHRSRVKFKRVSFLYTYNNDYCHPPANRPTPSPVRKLGVYEKIALYEQRPDLAPFYYVGGLLSHTPQSSPAAASSSLGIEELVLAPLDEAGEILHIGRTWKPRDANNRQKMIGGEAIVSVGSTEAVANFNYRDDVPYDEEEGARERNDCSTSTHSRFADTLSLLDVASGSDSRDDDDGDDGDDEMHGGNVRDECPGSITGGDMTRTCRLYGPRAVSSIIGCVTKEP